MERINGATPQDCHGLSMNLLDVSFGFYGENVYHRLHDKPGIWRKYTLNYYKTSKLLPNNEYIQRLLSANHRRVEEAVLIPVRTSCPDNQHV